jgi:3-oxoacyl-[acyl-carrier protein] reductase
METGLKNKVALVTGAAGGIGSAIAREFAGEGARVVVHYRSSEDRARAVADETGGIPIAADLTVEREVSALFDQAVARLGTVDILIANAGRWPSVDEPVWSMSYGRWKDSITTNLDSVFLCCRAFLRHVQRTGSGNITIVSSTAGLLGEAGHSDYAAAKGALASGFLRSLKNEITRIAPHGRVNVVCPGWIATDMTRDRLADESFVRRITRTMAMDKLGRAEEVARVVVTLSSDAISGHVSGEAVTVAGGMEGRVLRELERRPQD